MNQAKPENVLLYLKKAHDTVVPLAEKVFFDKGHALHRTSMALYSSIIELSGTCCLLVDSKHATAVPILVRAILEAYVDLSNLLKNPPYGYHLEAAYLKEWLKIL